MMMKQRAAGVASILFFSIVAIRPAWAASGGSSPGALETAPGGGGKADTRIGNVADSWASQPGADGFEDLDRYIVDNMTLAFTPVPYGRFVDIVAKKERELKDQSDEQARVARESMEVEREHYQNARAAMEKNSPTQYNMLVDNKIADFGRGGIGEDLHRGGGAGENPRDAHNTIEEKVAWCRNAHRYEDYEKKSAELVKLYSDARAAFLNQDWAGASRLLDVASEVRADASKLACPLVEESLSSLGGGYMRLRLAAHTTSISDKAALDRLFWMYKEREEFDDMAYPERFRAEEQKILKLLGGTPMTNLKLFKSKFGPKAELDRYRQLFSQELALLADDKKGMAMPERLERTCKAAQIAIALHEDYPYKKIMKYFEKADDFGMPSPVFRAPLNYNFAICTMKEKGDIDGALEAFSEYFNVYTAQPLWGSRGWVEAPADANAMLALARQLEESSGRKLPKPSHNWLLNKGILQARGHHSRKRSWGVPSDPPEPGSEAFESILVPRPEPQSTTERKGPAASESEQKVQVEWQGKWWDAVVRSRHGDTACIHYVGFADSWDECVLPERIR
jgi:hypothetical protein